jgi:hypothetical protein
MEEILSQPIFTVREKTYTWADATEAARLRGEWAALEHETRQGAACVKKAAASGDPVTRAAIESAAKQFRYTHDLITAQETSLWLNRWGLSVEEWMGHFHRALLRNYWSESLAEIVSEFPVTDAEISRLIIVDALCSGRFKDWAYKLAGRAAISDRLEQESPETLRAIDEDKQLDQKTKSLARLELLFSHFQKEIVTAKAVKDRIASRYLDWIRFECGYVRFASEAEANEAAMCVRDDGLALDEVARDAKRPLGHAVMYLDEVEASLKQHLLGAQKSSLVGPVKSGDEYALYWLIEKQMPTEQDPQIIERAEAAILKAAVSHEINNRVQWLVQL